MASFVYHALLLGPVRHIRLKLLLSESFLGIGDSNERKAVLGFPGLICTFMWSSSLSDAVPSPAILALGLTSILTKSCYTRVNLG